MSKNVKILDCTLRDGGRIIDCAFNDKTIADIASDLADANIDIVEMGFLRDSKIVTYEGHSTFFTSVSQIAPFLPPNRRKTTFVAFIDFDMYNFDELEYCDNTSITGIRVGFTKRQFLERKDEIFSCLKKVKSQGYSLYIQAVNSLGYTDRELLDVLELVNEVKPYSYGIVDTYGGMYLEDIIHYYNLVDYNLDPQICIDIHSHNNLQSSFTFAQEVIGLSGDTRQIILDCTLNGMGKCAGNLNTELIVDYLVRKKNFNYNTDCVLDVIDRYIFPYMQKCKWGYSIPAFMAGIYKAHPNNVIFLTEKYRLNSRDIKYILSGIDELKRQRYDYGNIRRTYQQYVDNQIDDRNTMALLETELKGKEILVLAPGKTIIDYAEKIHDYITMNRPIVICVNFILKDYNIDYVFFANTIHWEKLRRHVSREKCILSSNIHADVDGTNMVNYSSLIDEDSFLPDNSTIMLLNLLHRLHVHDICIAGFDGLSSNNDYFDESFPHKEVEENVDTVNKEIRRLYNQYAERVGNEIDLHFLTPSFYVSMEG